MFNVYIDWVKVNVEGFKKYSALRSFTGSVTALSSLSSESSHSFLSPFFSHFSYGKLYIINQENN